MRARSLLLGRRRTKRVAKPTISKQPLVGPRDIHNYELRAENIRFELNTISRAVRSADQGYMRAYINMLHDGRQKDGAIHSLLSTREKALTSDGWDILPHQRKGQDQPSPRAKRIADYCYETARGITNLTTNLKHLSGAIYHPYAVSEIQWGREGGYVKPLALHMTEAKRWGFNRNLELVLRDLATTSLEGDPVIQKNRLNFIVHQPRINGDSPQKEGLGRTLVWLAAFRRYAMRDWTVFSQMFSVPWKLARWMKGKADEEDIAAAEQFRDMATSATGFAGPDTIDVDIRWPSATGTTGGSPAADFLMYTDDLLSMTVLGQKGTMGAAQNGLGGNGEAHEAVRDDYARDDDLELSETLTEQLLVPMVAMRFGPAGLKDLPRWTFGKHRKDDRSQHISDMVQVQTGLGMRIDTGYIQQVTKFPISTEEPEEDEQEAPAEPEAEDDSEDASGPSEGSDEESSDS